MADTDDWTEPPPTERPSAPTATWFPPAFEPADFAGRYTVTAEIARSGMGIVYSAADRTLGREVAVKVVRWEQGAIPADVADRFAREARITGRLQHPGIPPVHDLGTRPDGSPFLAMKLIRGDTLHARLKGRDTPTADRDRFVTVFGQICQTVGYAHDQGVIHRDLKPANVMVGAFGEVQVIDWGLAKETRKADRNLPNTEGTASARVADFGSTSRGSETEFTQAGSVVGTPAYMPPEQARGEIERIDARSDVFSLGGILCDILTGKPPYTGSSITAVLEAAKNGEVDEATRRLAACGADAELVALAVACLDPDPVRRPADAGAVATAVAAYLSGLADRLRRAELEAAKAVERRKKRRVQLALGGAVLGLAGLLLFGLWWRDKAATQRRTEIALADAERQAEIDRDAAVKAAEVRRDAEGLLARIEQALRDDMLAMADTLVARADPTGWPADLRDRLMTATADADTVRRLDAAADTRGEVIVTRRRVTADAFKAVYHPFGRPLPADRFRGSVIRDRLVDGLDEWLAIEATVAYQKEMLDCLRELDPDPYRTAVRVAVAARDGSAVEKLLLGPGVASLSDRQAASVCRLSVVSPAVGLALVRDRADRRPTSFPLLTATTWLLGKKSRHPSLVPPNEAIPPAAETREACHAATGYARAALALRPDNFSTLQSLGRLHNSTDDPIRAAHYYRRTVELRPNDPHGWHLLGIARGNANEFLHAREDYARAYELRVPGDLGDHFAARCAAAAGEAAASVRDTDEAVRWAEKALALNAKNPEALALIGSARMNEGRLAEARDLLTRAAAGGSGTARKNLALLADLSDIQPQVLKALDGTLAVETATDLYDIGRSCDLLYGLHATAADYFAAAHASDPKSFDPLKHEMAARAALRAGQGKGDDAPHLPADRGKFRRQAAGWATRYLVALAALPKKDRDVVHVATRRLLADPEFAAVRPPELDKLPAVEQDLWRTLWADVGKLRDATARP